jgi:hypothetical protein
LQKFFNSSPDFYLWFIDCRSNIQQLPNQFEMISFLRISALCLSALPLAQAGKLVNTWRVDVGMPLYPEGITYDAANRRVILSSMASPILATFDPSNNMTLLNTYRRNDGYMKAVNCFGLKMDPSVRNRVWCAASDGVMDSGRALAYDIHPYSNIATLAFERSFPCANANNNTRCGAANDLTLDNKDVAFVTDTALGKVYRVRRTSTTGIQQIVADPLLQSVSPPFGANGIVRDGKVLIVGNYGLGTLVRVDLKTKSVANIAICKKIGNPDGMLLLKDKRLLVVTGSKLFVLKNDGDWRKVRVIEEIDIDQSKDGESATTAAIGSNDNEIFITYVRFGDVFGNSINANPSLVGRVMLNAN